MHSSDGVSYADGLGDYGSKAFNEILAVKEDGVEIYLSALMGSALVTREGPFDPKRLTPDQAADYLWRRFITGLER